LRPYSRRKLSGEHPHTKYICGKVAVVASVARIVAGSCACAASDHAAAKPPNRLMTPFLEIETEKGTRSRGARLVVA